MTAGEKAWNKRVADARIARLINMLFFPILAVMDLIAIFEDAWS